LYYYEDERYSEENITSTNTLLISVSEKK